MAFSTRGGKASTATRARRRRRGYAGARWNLTRFRVLAAEEGDFGASVGQQAVEFRGRTSPDTAGNGCSEDLAGKPPL
jgi:hypothetical protein